MIKSFFMNYKYRYIIFTFNFFIKLITLKYIIMNISNNSFDLTPRLKSSPVPVLFIPFKNNENNCNYCGNKYSKTLEFKQKYCKNCLFWYIKYTTGNDAYLDAYISTNNDR